MTLNLGKQQISASLEDYLEAIYEIFEEKQGVKAVEISRRLKVGRSSVTEALKSLAEKNLVNYGRYEVISLTEDGKKAAKNISQKHKILSSFFSDILGIEADEAQENACKIEHVISENALNKLAAFLQYQKTQKEKGNNFIDKFKDTH